MLAADVAKTLVVEGLQGLDSLHIMGPACGMVDIEDEKIAGTPSFQELMFVKFQSGYERDLAVGTLKSARLKHGDQKNKRDKTCGSRKTYQSQSEQKNVPYEVWLFDGSWVNGICQEKIPH